MGRVLFQDGDALSEGNLADWLPSTNQANFFEAGAGVTATYADDTVTVGAGEAYVVHDGGLYAVYPEEATLSLPVDNGDNYVSVVFDRGVDDSAQWTVASTEGGPADPKLLRAVVDTSGETVDTRNDDPDGDFDALTATEGSVETAPEDGADVARKTEVDAVQSNVVGVQSNLESHSTQHEDGGDDEVDATGLDVDDSGNTTDDHSARHENDGGDEISVAGLSGALADAQDPTNHASDHHDGGDDELDAADLAGGQGTDGQVLQTDGAAASWGGIPSSVEASETDDLSDLTEHTIYGSQGSGTWETLANVSTAGVLLSGTYDAPGNGNTAGVRITIDGGATQEFSGDPSNDAWRVWQDSNNDSHVRFDFPPIRFNDSLTIEIYRPNNRDSYGQAWVKS